MKKRPPFNVNSIIRGAIRRTFSRCPAALEVKNAGRREVAKHNKDGNRSKKDAVQYSCQICNQWVSSTKISVDHIEPVISIQDGFVDWNTFVLRMGFDMPQNLQRVCDDCHQVKTNGERFERTLKKDLENLTLLECAMKTEGGSNADFGHGTHSLFVQQGLKKFTKKKLASYSKDVSMRVDILKAFVKGNRK